jgi:DNA-binding beta-propeller fold protein YncE
MRLFFMNASQARARLVQAGAVLAAVAPVAGCGSAYRPVVTPINNSGPAAQVTSYVVVVSAPSPTTPGVASIVDYSGDTLMAEAPIGPGPTAFTIDEVGANGYTVNSDGTLSNFPISVTGTGSLQAKNVTYSTLSSALQNAPPHPPINMFSPAFGLWGADLQGSYVDLFTGSPQDFKLAIPVGATPVTIVGPGAGGQYNYAISQNIANPTGVECNISPTTGSAGVADAISTSTDTVIASIPLGLCPVFAVQSPDSKRLFVLNRGDDTITVINSQDNTLDTCTPFLNQNGQTVKCHPSLPLSLGAVSSINAQCAAITPPSTLPPCGGPPNGTSGMTKTAGPVYAEFNAVTNQLIVADYDGGTISVIDVSLDEYGNDSQTFGTTFTIPVGNNPASVTALAADGSRAYTANQADQTVTIVNLISHTVEKTLPVNGHPRTVVSTQNSTEGKVYAASPDSPFLTIIRTDQDIVDTTVLLEGNIVDVRVTTQNGSSGNNNDVSRVPGYGEPCYLPPTPSNPTPAPTGTQTLLQACQTLP